MEKRFTNRWPPPDLWSLFPNWAFARVTEGRPERDETTLEPADEQDRLSEEVDYTAGEAVLANGVVAPALIEVIVGKPWGVEIFPGAEHWSLQLLDDTNGGAASLVPPSPIDRPFHWWCDLSWVKGKGDPSWRSLSTARSNERAVEQRDATDKGREVCPLCLPLMGAVVEGGLCS